MDMDRIGALDRADERSGALGRNSVTGPRTSDVVVGVVVVVETLLHHDIILYHVAAAVVAADQLGTEPGAQYLF